jgi:Uma2 family endonuclease
MVSSPTTKGARGFPQKAYIWVRKLFIMVKIDLKKTYTVEEYLELEAKSESRHEFYYGNLFEMPGTTILHNELCIALLLILKSKLSKQEYRVLVESVKVRVKQEDVFLYPDVVVAPLSENPETGYILSQPILIAEVLSDSTRRYDSTDKFIQYRKIESLQYYLLVEPEKQVVIFYEKAPDGDWVSKTYTENEEEVKLPLLNATIRIGDIYGK